MLCPVLSKSLRKVGFFNVCLKQPEIKNPSQVRDIQLLFNQDALTC